MKIDRNLILRVISAIFLVAVLVSGVMYSPLTCFIVLTLIGVAGVYELLSILGGNGEDKPMRYFASVMAIAISTMLYFEVATSIIIAVVAASFIARMIAQVTIISTEPLKNMSFELFALVYALFPMLLLMQINGEHIVALFILVWINDVGAYFVGVSFGRHRLCERLSPKKSWEGYVGGIVSSMLVSIIIANYFKDSILIWSLTAIVVANGAVVGDLFESMIKRSLGVKDSGNVIPGHGGVLDRFDAMYFAAPLFYIIYLYIL